jgi:hypothetical protein
MHKPIDTREPLQVAAEVQEAYLEMFPQGDREFIPKIFQWAGTWFGGKYRDYQAIDAHYHDLEHTLQGILCMARLLRARHKLGQEPKLTQRMFELGMLAILLHDTGYLKKHGDNEGTGAKYTLTHVDRSIDFAGELMLSASAWARPICSGKWRPGIMWTNCRFSIWSSPRRPVTTPAK